MKTLSLLPLVNMASSCEVPFAIGTRNISSCLPLYSNFGGAAGKNGAPTIEIWSCVFKEVRIMKAKGERKMIKIASANAVTVTMFNRFKTRGQDTAFFVV